MICTSCRALLRAQRLPRTPILAASLSTLRPRAPRTQQFFTPPAPQRRAYTSSPEGTISPTPPSMTEAESAIAALLETKLSPTDLLVQDVSGGCGSMYAIDITSPDFRGKTVLKQQRMVNEALGDVLKGWHGVQIRTKATPE